MTENADLLVRVRKLLDKAEATTNAHEADAFSRKAAELIAAHRIDPDRLAVCAYWRCGELFERRSANQRYCRKACRSRQNKWLRAVERRRTKARS